MYRLLIVDRDEDVCESIRYLVDWNQYDISSVLTVSSYGDAINSLMDFLPHIAIVDIEMGTHWGYELAEHLWNAGVKTIFCMMSNQEDFHHARRSMRAGARDYLLKPINTKELRSFLERTIVRDLHGTLPDPVLSRPEVDPVLQVEYSKLSKITAKIILIVKSNYRRSLSLTYIAETLNMSSKYIGRIFLRDTGMKFSEYLTTYRMIQARRLIENTQEKISVVASMVGYTQLNNFYVHFKNYYHISPDAEQPELPVQEPVCRFEYLRPTEEYAAGKRSNGYCLRHCCAHCLRVSLLPEVFHLRPDRGRSERMRRLPRLV